MRTLDLRVCIVFGQETSFCSLLPVPRHLSVDTDERWMAKALDLATQNSFPTSPNPQVGAVIIQGDQIVSRGFHRGAGFPHAEIEAFQHAGAIDLRQCSLYVTLEPCSSKGRTSACTSAIIERGIGRVVYGCQDPNPAHAGSADEVLSAEGIEVVSGVLEDCCKALIRPFAKWVTTGLPWVVSKAGMSLDGRLTRPPGESSWITSEESRKDAMQLRATTDAVLIGAETLRSDDPSLTVRGLNRSPDRQPLRVILSRGGVLPGSARVFTDESTSRTLVLEGARLDLVDEVLAVLGQRDCCHVIIEGGGQMHRQFLDAGLVDEICYYLAPRLCVGGVSLTGQQAFVPGAASYDVHEMEVNLVGGDVRVSGLLTSSKT